MEFLLCMLIAAVFTGGRAATNIIHGVKGTTPPHVERDRLRAQREAARRAAATAKAENRGVRPGEDLPTFGDAFRVWRRSLWQDAIDYQAKVSAEKAAQRAADRTATETGVPAPVIRPPFTDRVKRFGLLLWNPVGENKPAETTDGAETAPADTDPPPTTGDGEVTGPSAGPRLRPVPDLKPTTTDQGDTTMTAETVTTAPAAPSGEAVNYETTVAELEKLAAVQREHVDQTAAAVKALEDAKTAVNNAQQSYGPAAESAQSINEHLTAMNLDSDTVAQTGTIADAMPPNVVDEMFEQIEAMEAAAQEQHANAEAALAATEAALGIVVGKYGDAHATVAGELAGDSRFLNSAAA